jgi:ABC-type Fe3+/spermidine/putrescine transport system ATPase subunit
MIADTADQARVSDDEPAQLPSAAPAVSFSGVSKHFGAISALDDVTFQVPDGELITLLGPSGCGKTTLLRIVAGFEKPSSGRVDIGGASVLGIPPEQRPVNLIFQRWALFPHKNVLENVLFGLEAARIPRREARERAREALRLCRMDAFESRRVQELSGGQAQRVAVARALVNRPKVLLLDEPLSALDLKLRRQLQLELRRLQQELAMTFVYVTHDQEEALAISDGIVVMHEGRVVQQSRPRQLYDDPNSLFAATFIGDANVLPCRVRHWQSGHATVEIGGLIATGRCGDPLAEGAAAKFCLRPERIRVGMAGGAYIGTVADVVFAGARVRYWLTLAEDVTLLAETPIAPGQPLLSLGAQTPLDWDADAAFVFAA